MPEALEIFLAVVFGLFFSIFLTASPLWLLLRFVCRVRLSYLRLLGMYVSAFVAAFVLVMLSDGFHYINLWRFAVFLVGTFILVPLALERCFSVSFWTALLTTVWSASVLVIMVSIPSFVESPTRAKVSEANGDMRRIATALHDYSNMNSQLPIPVDLEGIKISPVQPEDATSDSVVSATDELALYYKGPSFVPPDVFPESILSEVPKDPFHDDGQGPYGYGAGPIPSLDFAFILTSRGPDNESQAERLEFLFLDRHRGDEEDLKVDTEYCPLLYSPTNGTKSLGDICRLAP